MDEVIQSSVQKQGSADRSSFVMRWASYDKLLPSWWSPGRDVYLRDYWQQEDFIASTVYSVAVRNSQFQWQLTGLQEDVGDAQQLLQGANFGQGWYDFIFKVSQDLLTTDNGAFFEIIRPAKVNLEGQIYPAVKMRYENEFAQYYALVDNQMIALTDKAYTIFDMPIDLPIGIAHLDSGQCQRTGDPETPVIYTDRYGKVHRLKWWQVAGFADMPSPIEKMNGVGFCAVSRAFRTSHVLQSLEIYKDEKMSGRHNRAIHITNADPDLLNDQIRETQSAANNAGQLRYIQPIIASTFDPGATPAVVTLDLAGIPDGFNEEATKNWGVAVLALAFGVDYGFLAPLPGKGLGTSAQSETQKQQAQGKSSAQFKSVVMEKLNFYGILPESVQFEFKEDDSAVQEQQQKMSESRAKTRQIMLQSGEITPKVARQMAVDAGDLDESYLALMGDADITPQETIDGDQNMQAQEAVDAATKCKCGACVPQVKMRPYTINYAYVGELQAKFLQEKSLAQKIYDAARTLFWKKDIALPNTPSPESAQIMAEYAAEFEDLITQAQLQEISQSDFEEALQDLVISTIIILYALEAGIPADQITGADLTPLETIIAQNQAAIENLSTDIYDGRYAEAVGLGLIALLARGALWLASAASAAWLGTISGPENVDKKYRWTLNPVKENCESCLALDGQVHTGGEWAEFAVYPKSSRLFCNGFNCGCGLNEVAPSTAISGDLSTVPLQ